MSNFSIFTVPSFKVKYNAKMAIVKPSEEIITLLETNNNYYERIKHDSMLKFNLDIDGKSPIIIEEIIEELQNFFKQSYEVSYTQNLSKKNSYHVVIPKLYASSTNLKMIATNFKKTSKYEKFIDNGHLGVKESGKWLRLPNQYKENVAGTEHKIIKGIMEDFVLHYIPNDSILIKPEIKEIIIKETKHEKIYKEAMKNDYEYLITDEEIMELLEMLPMNYCNDYAPWLKITTILKSLNKEEIWDTYSKKSHKYDEVNNKI